MDVQQMDERMDVAHLTGRRRGTEKVRQHSKGGQLQLSISRKSFILFIFFFFGGWLGGGVHGGGGGGGGLRWGADKLPSA